MPIYDYRCDACDHVFSAVQSYQDESLESCPQCAARPRRKMTSPAIVFKGSGWYKTDSRGKEPVAPGAPVEPRATDGGSASGSTPAKAAGDAAAGTTAAPAKTSETRPAVAAKSDTAS